MGVTAFSLVLIIFFRLLSLLTSFPADGWTSSAPIGCVFLYGALYPSGAVLNFRCVTLMYIYLYIYICKLLMQVFIINYNNNF